MTVLDKSNEKTTDVRDHYDEQDMLVKNVEEQERAKPMQQSVEAKTGKLWETANQNGWYKRGCGILLKK